MLLPFSTGSLKVGQEKTGTQWFTFNFKKKKKKKIVFSLDINI